MMDKLRRLALFNQGLGQPHAFGEGLVGTRCAIEHLGYVQLDTISVIERAHHHVLWNRVPDYQPTHLNQLVKEQHIFEYWFHAASYLPMRDYRYVLAQMASIRKGENRYFRNADPHLMNEILAQVKAEGEIRLRNIDTGKKVAQGGWWNRGPGRRALELLFMQGDLMISARNGMEKVYDLRENCLPSGIDLTLPSLNEYAQYLFNTTLRAHGVFTWKQLLHLKVGQPLRAAMQTVVLEQLDAGVITLLDNIGGQKIYADTACLEQPPAIALAVKILSPFDNLVIHRDRLSSLFAFEYRIECYVPAEKRVFGYFCLPILYGNQMVARIDCKAHRAEQRLEVLSLHLEDSFLDRDAFFPQLILEIQRFAAFNQCSIDEAQLLDTINALV